MISNIEGNSLFVNTAFTSVPITEVVAGGVPLSVTGGNVSLDMDTRFYQVGPAVNANNGIWAAAITGSFITLPTEPWSVTLSGGGGTVSFQCTEWAANYWKADVNSVTPVSGMNLEGKAAGTYNDGATPEISGAATGTWEKAEGGGPV